MCILLSYIVQLYYNARWKGHRITGYTQRNGAVSKVSKTFIPHLTWAQSTPSAAATVDIYIYSPARCVFSKPCTKLTLHCNHRSGHLKTEHTESLYLL